MRRFIRHPAEIPIEVRRDDRRSQGAPRTRNVSLGGLAFRSAHRLEPGAVVEVEIPFVRPGFRSAARVVWCTASAGAFELGVEFLDAEDAFRARMVEQVCHIEEYRRAVARVEGRVLTVEEAASERIDKYASQFPDADADS
ncbi:MAG: PilZ domain-containing protein [Burkholderiales bacterium]|nr:PilZ domain-containing protein [Burkholderiales bacterium]